MIIKRLKNILLRAALDAGKRIFDAAMTELLPKTPTRKRRKPTTRTKTKARAKRRPVNGVKIEEKE